MTNRLEFGVEALESRKMLTTTGVLIDALATVGSAVEAYDGLAEFVDQIPHGENPWDAPDKPRTEPPAPIPDVEPAEGESISESEF